MHLQTKQRYAKLSVASRHRRGNVQSEKQKPRSPIASAAGKQYNANFKPCLAVPFHIFRSSERYTVREGWRCKWTPIHFRLLRNYINWVGFVCDAAIGTKLTGVLMHGKLHSIHWHQTCKRGDGPRRGNRERRSEDGKHAGCFIVRSERDSPPTESSGHFSTPLDGHQSTGGKLSEDLLFY
ncbi:hypothetical protein ZHAS_00009129 [Anopheles sinensis]|uniref:Uncharacterized protein n=1 Tax=Anopheles sinensis TaxID=74873 RepID=A0A084VU80_ANOSI|nr:hypothetical protein ZHAS_00009129 [Anopheles sinensis]